MSEIIFQFFGSSKLIPLLSDIVSNELEKEVNGNTRTVMKLSPKISPIKAAIFPLMNKLNMPELAEKLVKDFRDHNIASFYDAGGSIGKRYRRQDEAGTPFGITIDHDTLEDNTITLRNRDTMNQERIGIDNIISKVKDLIITFN